MPEIDTICIPAAHNFQQIAAKDGHQGRHGLSGTSFSSALLTAGLEQGERGEHSPRDEFLTTDARHGRLDVCHSIDLVSELESNLTGTQCPAGVLA